MKKINLAFLLIVVLLLIGCFNSSSTDKQVPLDQINTQKHSNTLLPIEDFLSFIGNVEYGESKLLKMDFSFAGTSKSKIGLHKYYKYRLNHTFNSATNYYDFDIFSITNDLNRFSYSTTSAKNYQSYKEKLIQFGFSKSSEDTYQLAKNNSNYEMHLERKAGKSSTYIIRISK